MQYDDYVFTADHFVDFKGKLNSFSKGKIITFFPTLGSKPASFCGISDQGIYHDFNVDDVIGRKLPVDKFCPAAQ